MEPDKARLRKELLARRATMSEDARRTAGRDLAARLLATPEVSRARVVAGYVGVGTEPVTLDLLTDLRNRGVRVLLPVLRPDDDLAWGEFTGAEGLVPAGRGLLEPPVGPLDGPLGVDAVTTADVVLCPGIAVDRRGHRLGRGGGSYDRALSRLTGSAPWTCVLLYDGEVLDAVPVQEHDRRVDAVATPSAVIRLRPTG